MLLKITEGLRQLSGEITQNRILFTIKNHQKMKLKSFFVLYVSRLSIADLFSLNKSTIEIARPVKENIGDVPKAALILLETINAELGAQLNKQTRSALTNEIAEIDKDRDNRFAEIKRNITTARAGRDEAKKKAADSLKILFEPYWKIEKIALNTETILISGLIEKINASETYKAQAKTIGITTMLNQLETTNNMFDTLYTIRNTQEANKDKTSASSLRPEAARSYEQFCLAVEQALNFVPTETLLVLFSQMDELRRKYARLISKPDETNNDTTTEPKAE